MMRGICRCTATRLLVLAIPFALTVIATQPAHAQSFQVIYTFAGHSSSANPIAGVTLDQHGNLFGTTAWGGQFGGGTVFELKRTPGGQFLYSDLHDLGGGQDGA